MRQIDPARLAEPASAKPDATLREPRNRRAGLESRVAARHREAAYARKRRAERRCSRRKAKRLSRLDLSRLDHGCRRLVGTAAP